MSQPPTQRMPSDQFPGPEDLPRLAQALRGADTRIPAALDDAVEAMVLPPRTHLRWAAPVAAMVLLGLTVWTIVQVIRVQDAPLPHLARWDVNADGQVDVLDAMTLSRRLDGGWSDVAGDLNADGHVDHADLIALHTRIVAMPTISTSTEG